MPSAKAVFVAFLTCLLVVSTTADVDAVFDPSRSPLISYENERPILGRAPSVVAAVRARTEAREAAFGKRDNSSGNDAEVRKALRAKAEKAKAINLAKAAAKVKAAVAAAKAALTAAPQKPKTTSKKSSAPHSTSSKPHTSPGSSTKPKATPHTTSKKSTQSPKPTTTSKHSTSKIKPKTTSKAKPPKSTSSKAKPKSTSSKAKTAPSSQPTTSSASKSLASAVLTALLPASSTAGTFSSDPSPGLLAGILTTSATSSSPDPTDLPAPIPGRGFDSGLTCSTVATCNSQLPAISDSTKACDGGRCYYICDRGFAPPASSPHSCAVVPAGCPNESVCPTIANSGYSSCDPATGLCLAHCSFGNSPYVNPNTGLKKCINTVNDVGNCGAPNNVCQGSYNGIGSPTCIAGTCGLQCPPGRVAGGTPQYCKAA